MNKLSLAKRTQIVACLVEGNSIRATSRMTGAAKGTVLKVLRDLGCAAREYQDKALRNLPCKRIQCDENWAFVGAKDRTSRPTAATSWASAASGRGRRSAPIPS